MLLLYHVFIPRSWLHPCAQGIWKLSTSQGVPDYFLSYYGLDIPIILCTGSVDLHLHFGIETVGLNAKTTSCSHSVKGREYTGELIV